MRLLLLLVVALGWPSLAPAQQTSIGACTYVYSDVSSVPDPRDDQKILRVEYRRRDGLPVEVRCGDIQVFAQEMDYSESENRLDLRGQVVFQQKGARIAAVSGRFDLKTRLAVFETASGTLQLTDRQLDRSLFGTMEPEAFFTADRIEKKSADTYVLINPTFTTCVQPSRRWQIKAGSMTLTVDRHAVMRNAVLQVKDVSVLYLPVFYYPISEGDRATGFLMPSYGSSTYRGFTLSNAFFWAISRSTDATIYHDWFSRSGHGLGADFRYVREGGAFGNANVYIIDDKPLLSGDGSRVILPGGRSYEFRGAVNQTLPGGIRVQARTNYFTSAASQQLYQNDFARFTQQSRSFGVDASGRWGRIRGSLQADRYDQFYGSSATSYRTQPRIGISVAEAPIGRTKIYTGASLDAVSFVRIGNVDRPETRQAVFRTDGQVLVRAPWSVGSALSLTASLSARRTEWNARQTPDTKSRVEAPVTRHLVEGQLRMSGPVFTRVWNTPGAGRFERLKHVIQPTLTIVRRTAFDKFDEVIALDPSVDLVVGDVTQMSYGVTQRLLARVRSGSVQEIASLDVQQSYYSNPEAAQYDGLTSSSFGQSFARLPPPGDFGPVRVSLNLSPSAGIRGQFGLEYDTKFAAVRQYRASASISQPVAEFTGSWSKQQVIPGLLGYADPRNATHSLSLSSRVKGPEGRSSLSYATGLDLQNRRFVQHRFGAFYNAQCCGIAVDYVIVNYSHFGLRNDKRLSVSISLAGIGSFVNPLGVFGNNGQQ